MGDLAEILWEMERGLDQVQFMLTVITAFIGVIVASMFIYGIVAFIHFRHAKQATLVSLQSELKMNLGVIEDMLEASVWDSSERYETVPMSEVAWRANIGGDGLTHIDKHMIEPLTQTYSRVHRANLYADRIEGTQYNPESAAQYSRHLKAAQDDLAKTLKLLEQRS